MFTNAGPLTYSVALLCFLALLVHSLHIGLPYLIHFYDNARTNKVQRPSLGGYLRAFRAEWFFSLSHNLVYPFGVLGGGVHGQFDPNGGPPIVLLHGYMGNRSSFFTLCWRLKRRGYRNLYAINLRPLSVPIEQQSEQVSRLLRSVSTVAGGRKVIAIGHSQGGVILRHVCAHDPETSVEKVITLGSPHRGTGMAFFGIHPAARDLRPGAKVLEMPQSKVPIVSFWSDLDQMITPADSAKLDQHRFFAETGHRSFLHRTAVFEAVVEQMT